MSGASDSSSQIHDELLAEVKLELDRRGTSQVTRKPEPTNDTVATFAVTAILTCLALLAGTGIAMSLVYVPSLEDASASTAWFQSGGMAGTLGGIVRAVHFHAANILVALSAAYLGYLAWKGLFRRPEQWRWWRAAILLALVVGFSLTGQTLPADQVALHGTNIRLNYLAELPVFGEMLRQLVQGGDSIGSATLGRFFAMHVVVLPAISLILLRWIWKDGESDRSLTPHFGVAGAVTLLVVVFSLLFVPPLGLHGNLSEPYPQARPEWFALPLYALLKIAPAGVLHSLILFVPPLLGGALVVALPFLETSVANKARLTKPIRIGLALGFVLFVVFAAIPMVQDKSNNDGWFSKYTPEDIMTAMGSRNAELRNSAEPVPDTAHNHARDLELLHERLIGNYPDPIDDPGRKKWDELAVQGVAAARALRMAANAESQRKHRAELRQVCEDCHKLHEKEEVRIDPPALFARQGQTDKPIEPEFFFDAQKMQKLKPTELPAKLSTTKLMDQMKYRLKDILIESGALTDNRGTANPLRSREQAMLDLIDQVKLLDGYYEKNEGAYYEKTKWNDWVAKLAAASEALSNAGSATEVVKLSAEVGKACEACHDGADEPDEPIEWTFQSLLAGED